MKHNTKGSILVTAIVIIMVIMVLLGAALTISSSYYKNSVINNTKKQVYLSAKSGVELISTYIIQNNPKIKLDKVGDTLSIDSFMVDGDVVDKVGTITLIDNNTIKVVITANFDEYVYKMQADLKKSNQGWEVHSFCEAKAGDALC